MQVIGEKLFNMFKYGAFFFLKKIVLELERSNPRMKRTRILLS